MPNPCASAHRLLPYLVRLQANSRELLYTGLNKVPPVLDPKAHSVTSYMGKLTGDS